MGVTYHVQISAVDITMLETEFQDGTIITVEVLDCYVHAIGKAIRPLFADPVTNVKQLK